MTEDACCVCGWERGGEDAEAVIFGVPRVVWVAGGAGWLVL